MIVFVTYPGHEYTVAPLAERHYGPELPAIAVSNYGLLFQRTQLPEATYVFCDVDRLDTRWEQQLAADMFRAAQAAGLRCLNDPARVMGRFELMRTLFRLGINPYNVYLADDLPQPERFPVFIRGDADHGGNLSGLIETQGALEQTLAAIRAQGMVLRGLLVVEYCGAPIAPGIWRKCGTFRVGETISRDHTMFGPSWVVKETTFGLATDDLLREERDAVVANHRPAAISAAFTAAGIDYGRLDHATVNGRDVIYEINLNPTIPRPTPQPSPIRAETKATARERLAMMLWRIDSGSGRPIDIGPGNRLAIYRDRNGDRPWCYRP